MTVEELEELEEHLGKLKKWIATEYKYTVELKKDLEEVESNEEADENLKILRKAYHALRWSSRSERKVHREENRVHEAIEALEKILPENLREEAKKLDKAIDLADKKLTKENSYFDNNLRKELDKIKTYEQLLDLKKSDEDKINDSLKQLEEHVKSEVVDLIKWINGMEVIREDIVKFEKELERKAAN